MSIAVVSIAVLIIFGTAMIPDNSSTDMTGNFCYDEDMEGYICFDTLKACEIEQGDDVMAESQCYES